MSDGVEESGSSPAAEEQVADEEAVALDDLQGAGRKAKAKANLQLRMVKRTATGLEHETSSRIERGSSSPTCCWPSSAR